MRLRLHRLALSIAVTVAAASCATDNNSLDTAAAAVVSTPSTDAVEMTVTTGQPFPDARCAQNRQTGTIRFLTSSDDAKGASTIHVTTASASGYFDEFCLDVEIVTTPDRTAAYEGVASGGAEFAAGGGFSELVSAATSMDAPLRAVVVAGRTTTDTLIVKAGTANSLNELAGTTIGVTDELPAPIDVMLRDAGLVENQDYETTVLSDSADPVTHLSLPIDGLTGNKNDEVGVYDREGVGVQQFDPSDYGVPGSFGVIFSSAEFIDAHPTAAEDFVRATMRGLADAVADPAAAIATEAARSSADVDSIETKADLFRWDVEAELILAATPEDIGLGVPDVDILQAELDSYAGVGYFGGTETPQAGDFVAVEVSANLYDRAALIIP